MDILFFLYFVINQTQLEPDHEVNLIPTYPLLLYAFGLQYDQTQV